MKKLPYILYGLLLVAVAGLLVYDYLPDHRIESSDLTRAGLLTAGIVLGMLKAGKRQGRSVASKKTVYTNSYPRFIQNVFPDDKKSETLFFRAVDDYNRNRPSQGIEKLSKLRAECRNSAERFAVTVFTALCLDDMGLYEKAAESYREAIQIKPDTTLYSNLGLALERMGKPEESVEAYLQAIRLDPGNVYPVNNLAQSCIRMGDYAQGLEYARQAISLNPKMPQALNAMTICSYMMGNMTDYETYYRQAVSNGSDGQKLKAFIQSLDSTI